MVRRNPKPSTIQHVFERRIHPSDAALFDGLQSADWTNLPLSVLRDCSPNIAFLTEKAWTALIPALMLAALLTPFVTWETDGTLVTDFVAIMTDRHPDGTIEVWRAIESYSNEERAVISEWFQWYTRQHPNFKKMDEYSRVRFLEIRKEEARIAETRIQSYNR